MAIKTEVNQELEAWLDAFGGLSDDDLDSMAELELKFKRGGNDNG